MTAFTLTMTDEGELRDKWRTASDNGERFRVLGELAATDRLLSLIGCAAAHLVLGGEVLLAKILDELEDSACDEMFDRSHVRHVVNRYNVPAYGEHSNLVQGAVYALCEVGQPCKNSVGLALACIEYERAHRIAQGEYDRARRQSNTEVADILVYAVGPGWGAFDPQWRTSSAVGVARRIYADKAWGDCPVLADALQDAGMPEDHKALAYLRGGGAKFRGCWVIDYVLEKR